MTPPGRQARRRSLADDLLGLLLAVMSAECSVLGTGQPRPPIEPGPAAVVDMDQRLEQLADELAAQGVGVPDIEPQPDAEAPGTEPPGTGPSPDEHIAGRPASLPFLRWVSSHCYADRLGPSSYTMAWLRYAVPREDLDPEAIMPVAAGVLPPAAGSPEAKEVAAQLEREWLAEPRSRTVDCRFAIEERRCRTCTQTGRGRYAHYIAYLPRALFVAPERVRSILMIIPGGRGGRSRAFLSPLPNKTPFHRGSGGLQTKQQVDRFLAAHPDAPPPIVVSIETNGAEYVNGSIEHLSHDLPLHISETYLGGVPLTELTLGAEGISSGARAIVETLHAKPATFATAGLTCMACGLIDPRNQYLRERVDFDGWGRDLGQRAARGELFVRFAIGSRDGQLPCSRALYELLGEHGVVDLTRPARYSSCHYGHDGEPAHCDTETDGFMSYVGEMHHYGLLKKSYPPQLLWHLERLAEVTRRRAAK